MINASLFASEIARAQTFGTEPPSMDEIYELCNEVRNHVCEVDCDECGEATKAARDFEQAVWQGNAAGAGESLALLLSGFGNSMRDARQIVDEFARLCIKDAEKQAS